MRHITHHLFMLWIRNEASVYTNFLRSGNSAGLWRGGEFLCIRNFPTIFPTNSWNSFRVVFGESNRKKNFFLTQIAQFLDQKFSLFNLEEFSKLKILVFHFLIFFLIRCVNFIRVPLSWPFVFKQLLKLNWMFYALSPTFQQHNAEHKKGNLFPCMLPLYIRSEKRETNTENFPNSFMVHTNTDARLNSGFPMPRRRKKCMSEDEWNFCFFVEHVNLLDNARKLCYHSKCQWMLCCVSNANTLGRFVAGSSLR